MRTHPATFDQLVGTMYLSETTLVLFSLFNVLRLGSYVPQIARVATDTEGARAISYSTWSIWIGANGSTAAYAIVNITDWTLFAVSAVNALGCAAVVLLTMWKRHQFARRSAR
jgi:hypothetical protein